MFIRYTSHFVITLEYHCQDWLATMASVSRNSTKKTDGGKGELLFRVKVDKTLSSIHQISWFSMKCPGVSLRDVRALQSSSKASELIVMNNQHWNSLHSIAFMFHAFYDTGKSYGETFIQMDFIEGSSETTLELWIETKPLYILGSHPHTVWASYWYSRALLGKCEYLRHKFVALASKGDERAAFMNVNGVLM